MERNDSCPACRWGRRRAGEAQHTSRHNGQLGSRGHRKRTMGTQPKQLPQLQGTCAAAARAVCAFCLRHAPRAHAPLAATHRVPNLQLDLLVVNVDHACTKLNTNCEVVHRLKALVGELKQQA